MITCSDVYVTARGKSNVQVKKLECDVCKVQLEEGECLLHSVKVGGLCVTRGRVLRLNAKIPAVVGLDLLDLHQHVSTVLS